MTSRLHLLLLLLLAGCASVTAPIEDAPPHTGAQLARERQLSAMGTRLKITALGPDAQLLDRAIDAACAELMRVEDLMTDWRQSPLTELNDSAGSGPHSTPRELVRLIARSLEVSALTGGSFDVTFSGVGQLWDFRRQPAVVPSNDAIAAALVHVDHRQVAVDLQNNTVELPAGFRIGLGGIAKGYGVDRAMKMLLDHGVQHAIVNAGGDMKVLGKHFGQPWEVAIKHPRDRDRAIAVLRISNACVVTSGDYERFFEIDGERYHHILDPATGRPATGAMSATVVAPDAALADAIATALCVLGPEQGLAIVAKLPRVEALIIDLKGDAHASPGLQGLFR